MRTIARAMSIGAVLLAGASLAEAQVTGAMETFAESVAAYAALHHQVERLLPPQQSYVDPAEGLAYAAALSRALCAVRPNAREGDVFGPAAGEIRRQVRYVLRAHGIEVRDLMLEMAEDTEDGARLPVVNEAFSWALGNLMPAAVIAALPPLPDELQYRLVGNTLVLIDVHASLVVDLLRNVLLVETTRE
jgi:hypothetical protein